MTECNLQDAAVLAEVNLFIANFERNATKFDGFSGEGESPGLILPRDIEVFIGLEDDCWEYYCVDQDQRRMFWIDEIDLTWMSDGVGTVPTPAYLSPFKLHCYHVFCFTHICFTSGYGLDYEYWLHVEHFPYQQELGPSVLNDLMAAVVHGSIGIALYWNLYRLSTNRHAETR